MAEVIRISEAAEPAASASLPQNVEAEAALLGALMIDNRLVEDVQLKLKPHHFFTAAFTRPFSS
jgi:replicative DNA helicase